MPADWGATASSNTGIINKPSIKSGSFNLSPTSLLTTSFNVPHSLGVVPLYGSINFSDVNGVTQVGPYAVTYTGANIVITPVTPFTFTLPLIGTYFAIRT